MSKSKFTKDKAVGYGFVGEWNNGTIGWCLPSHLSNGSNTVEKRPWNVGEDSFYCRITIERMKNKKGKYIKRKIV